MTPAYIALVWGLAVIIWWGWPWWGMLLLPFVAPALRDVMRR